MTSMSKKESWLKSGRTKCKILMAILSTQSKTAIWFVSRQNSRNMRSKPSILTRGMTLPRPRKLVRHSNFIARSAYDISITSSYLTAVGTTSAAYVSVGRQRGPNVIPATASIAVTATRMSSAFKTSMKRRTILNYGTIPIRP